MDSLKCTSPNIKFEHLLLKYRVIFLRFNLHLLINPFRSSFLSIIMHMKIFTKMEIINEMLFILILKCH